VSLLPDSCPSPCSPTEREDPTLAPQHNQHAILHHRPPEWLPHWVCDRAWGPTSQAWLSPSQQFNYSGLGVWWGCISQGWGPMKPKPLSKAFSTCRATSWAPHTRCPQRRKNSFSSSANDSDFHPMLSASKISPTTCLLSVPPRSWVPHQLCWWKDNSHSLFFFCSSGVWTQGLYLEPLRWPFLHWVFLR
jgi:hypothetical protein